MNVYHVRTECRLWFPYVHTRRVMEPMAAVAPAEAISCLALTLLVTLGKLLFPVAMAGPVAVVVPAPVLMRLLLVEVCMPLTVDCLRGAALLLGLTAVASFDLTANPFLKLVAGGSGRGLFADGVVIVLNRLIGDSFREVVGTRAVGTADFCPVRNSCRIASSGFIRLSGSHLRQRVRKSRKASSSHFSACCKDFEDGRRRRPLEETVKRGFPSESKKSFLRVLFSIRCFSGGPNTSIMQASCSCSFSPGKIG